MSVKSTSWAWEQRVGNAIRKLVLWAIADECDDSGFGYPSIKRIAFKAEVSTRTVQRVIRDLEAANLLAIDRERTRSSGGQTSNGYQLAMHQLQLEGGVTTCRTVSVSGVTARRSDNCVTPNEQQPPTEVVFISKGSTKRKPTLTPIPEGFQVSQRVRKWYAEKGYAEPIAAHLENFVSTCRAKSYVYADFDEALMGAIRKDWANLRKAVPGAPRQTSAPTGKVCGKCASPKIFGSVGGRWHCASRACRDWAMFGDGPAEAAA